MVLLRGDATALLSFFAEKVGASAAFWNRCYESHAISRDKGSKALLKQRGIEALCRGNGADHTVRCVFSADSINTAVGTTEHVPIMNITALIAVLTMLLAATPLSNFICANLTLVILALGFLVMIGAGVEGRVELS